MMKMPMSLLVPVFLFIVSSPAFLAFSPPAWAAQATDWGCVNKQLLILFHPDMASFDYSRGLFFRQNPAKQVAGGQTQLSALNQAWKNVEPALKPLIDQQNQLNSQLISVHLIREAGLQEFPLPKPPQKLSPEELKKRRLKRQEIEAEYSKKLSEIHHEQLKVSQNIDSLVREAEKAVYLTREETFYRLYGILTDIDRRVQTIAAQLKLAVVFDSSYGKRHFSLDPELPQLRRYDEVGDALACDIFQFLLNWQPAGQTPTVTLPEGRPMLRQAFNAALFSLPLGRQAAHYVERNPRLTHPILGFSTGTSCLSGFRDITPETAHGLLAEFPISAELRDQVTSFLRDFVELQRDGRQLRNYPQSLISEP